VPDDLPAFFEAGFSTRPGSSGLGLAVCRRILEQPRGIDHGESRPGHGATFRLRLPGDGTAAERAAKLSSGNVVDHAEPAEAGNEALLIATTMRGMRAALETRFQRRGWLVDVAVNGTEALDKFRAGQHSAGHHRRCACRAGTASS